MSLSVRSVSAALVLGALGLTALAGCAVPEDPAKDAHQSEWMQKVLDAGGHGVGGVMSGETSDEGVRMEFPTPQKITSVELRCIGTDSASFSLRYTSTDGSVLVLTQDLVCHGGEYRTPIAVPTTVGDLSAFAADATSPDGRGTWVAIPHS